VPIPDAYPGPPTHPGPIRYPVALGPPERSGRAGRAPDPGSRTGSLIAKLIAIPLLLTVIVLQQASIYLTPPTTPPPEAPVVAPGPDDQALLVTRLMLKISKVFPALGAGGEPLNSIDALWIPDSPPPESPAQRDWRAALDARVLELRAAMVAGEVTGPDAALTRLATLDDRLHDDADALSIFWHDADLGDAEPDWTDPDAVFRRVEELDASPTPEIGPAELPVSGDKPTQAATDAAARAAAAVTEADELAELINNSGQVIRILRADITLLRRHYTALDRAAHAQPGSGAQPVVPSAPPTTPFPSPAQPQRLVLPDFTSPLDEPTWTALSDRHGWFADLARLAATPHTDPARVEMFKNGGPLLVMILLAGAVIGSVAVGSFCACIWLIVMLAMRRIRFWFVPPAPGGSVYLETVAVFIVAFLSTQVLAAGVAAMPALQNYATEVAMGMQWLVLLCIFWPLLRGVSVSQWRRDLGLIAPRGVLREIGAGFLAYLACLPLLVVAGLVGVVLKSVQDDLLKDHIPYTTGGNPVLEMVSSGSLWQIALLVALATIWAPIVEETVFRGCLFRHLRARVGFLIAAPASALAFGLMHQYEIVLLGPVLALGVMFAFMREWRGSLIGPIVMHALHNGTVLLFVISLVRLSA